jgi:predicted helicase
MNQPMSKLLINQYYSNLDKVYQFGKSKNEQSIRIPFFNLLNEYAHKQNYELLAKITYVGMKGQPVMTDGNVVCEIELMSKSALEWILDQYKEKKPTDPTIAEKFNTYRFADYKEHVIDLLKRVCTVSVETMKIICEMETTEPHI